DGHIAIAAGNNELFARMCTVLNREDMATDERFATNPKRMENFEALHQEMELALSARTSAEWLAALDAAGVPNGPLNNVADVMADPQVLYRNMIIETLDPDLGPIRMQGNPVKLSAHHDPKTRTAAPELDQHRAAILKELGIE
ncbi:MAG: CoA transferase, partial [Alphaproteobacteria bacterium]|nr:CoA transferase [Alphaproteobacteria bacterium]